ncbi:MAG: hypothetical protein CMJ34_13220 [Phycisphaerae bacterium]|nr:hypothetical protein [Phycisphaerae bacterium]
MEFSRDIKFGFKGGRDYIHGPDMYAAVRDRLFDKPPERIINLTMHRLLRGDARVVELAPGHEDVVAEVMVDMGGEEHRLGFQPAGEASIAVRAYAEDEIANRGELVSGGGRLDVPTGFDSIEEAVALIKSWSNRFQPVSGRWVVARIDAIGGSSPLPRTRDGDLEIRHAGGIAKKLNRFEVTCDGAEAMVFFGARG